MSTLRTEDVTTFARTLSGVILEPEAPGYEDARRVWNGMFDRRPRLIAPCRSAAEVAATIRFAREHELPLAVRGGGHNIAGTGTCDDGVLLDLSPMRSVVVDRDRRLASVGGGCLLGDVDAATQQFRLATPLGINSTTGVGGLTLGGGFGWLSRKHGMTIDNLRSAEVVTADGRILRTSETQHPDLFWGLRGGGGNFGVVTEFEFALHPVGPEVYAGLVVYPLTEAPEVLREYARLNEETPEDLSVWVVARSAPPLPFLPDDVHGTPVLALALCYVGPPHRAEPLTAPFRQLGTVLGEHVGWQPYTAWQQAFDPLLTPGARNYWKSHNLGELSDGAIDLLVEAGAQLPSPECELFVASLGEAAARVPVEATAYAGRGANYVLNVHARWRDPDDDRACIEWARRLFEAMKPHASGHAYVNFFTQEESERVQAAYGPNYRRLTEVKRRYDPSNVFRLNQNVPPA